MAPSLIQAIKVAGLVLVADVSTSSSTIQDSLNQSSNFTVSTLSQYSGVAEGVNGVLDGKGILRFYDTIDM
jgi:hypothetical protein